MKFHLLQLNLFLLGLSLCSVSFGQEIDQKTPVVTVQKITSSVKIDGRLNETVWQNAHVIHQFIQREPHDGQPVSEQTEVRILYDSRNLYFGFRCRDSHPEKIVANEMRRDMKLLDNDCVEIFLDTFHDNRNAFYFCTNPLGAQWDGLLIADVSDDNQNWDWNGVWENASSIDSAGWTAEIAIPFKTLRFKQGNDLTWGMNLSRRIPRKREEAYWSPISREYGFFGKYRISAYGELTGLEKIAKPAKWELKPYLLPGVQQDNSAGEPVEKTFEYGLDIKYHLTSNLIADASWNTDFAQVEADQEQVNLTRFELFFPEKRDFFLEGANIFSVGEKSFNPMLPANMLFFSRRIGLSADNRMVPLLGGVKVTGKTGRYNIGVLNMLADRTRYTKDDEEVSIPQTNYSVFRLKRDILNNSSVGVIGLNKESLDNHDYNRTLAFDTEILLSRNARFNGFLAKTATPGLKGKDYALHGEFQYMDDFYWVMFSQNSIQDHFNPEMGFVPRIGVRKTNLNISIAPRPGILNIRQFFLFHNFFYFARQNNILETRWNNSGFFSVFQNGAVFMCILNQKYERLDDGFILHDDVGVHSGIYRFHNFLAQFESDKSKLVSGSITFNSGDFYDGKITSYGAGADLKFGAHFTWNLNYYYNDITLPDGRFTASIVGSRLIYTFTPILFVKAFIQWNSARNLIIGNFLLSFIHRPGSDLFLVYNEEWDKSKQNFVVANRAIKLKFTYLMNLSL